MSRRWLGPVVIALMVAFSIYAYGRLPEQVATHWDSAGEANGWSSRAWAAALAPLVALVLWLLLQGLRRIDPRRANYARFEQTFWVVANALVVLIAAIHVITLGSALGWGLEAGSVIVALVGALYVVVGNYLPRLRSNWWFGIRTPWTLSSDRVWQETHRFGGKTFVAGGLIAVAAALLPAPAQVWLAMPALVLAPLSAGVYSYFAWRRAMRGA